MGQAERRGVVDFCGAVLAGDLDRIPCWDYVEGYEEGVWELEA